MKILRIFLFFLAGLLVVLAATTVTLGLLPVPSEPQLDPAAVLTGARPPQANGLQAEPARLRLPGDNPMSAEKVALGQLLFFDPLLSKNNDLACATCHNPDMGFGDGKPTSDQLTRNASSIYNVGFQESFFWDGRAASLEEQSETPLTAPKEMAADPAVLEAELSAVAEYRVLFEAAFPGQEQPVSYQNTRFAIAAFERNLAMGNSSPFDRYLAGDTAALSPSQRRGLALFRSGATGCYTCHPAPTFTSGLYEVTGVPGADGKLDDPGRIAISGVEAERYAFKVPSLRNVALSAPYMHNGVFKTLDEVVDFYIKGGGQGLGLDLPNQARAVGEFDLNPQERQDLIAFLYALTDDQPYADIPASVPSGLPVVAHIENPALAAVKAANTGTPAAASRPNQTLTVKPDMTIQSVVDQAIPGDTIEIEYGVYHERVLADLDNLTIRGIPNAAGEYPLLDGQMAFADGLAMTGDNLLIEKIAAKNYKGNGIIVTDSTNLVIRDVYVENTSLYGVYPTHSTNVLVERVEATNIRDAGVYAGQCRDVVVRDVTAYGNVLGIEIENTLGAEVYNNRLFDNTTGILVDLLPRLPSKASRFTKVHDNRIENNNAANFALPGESAGVAPAGTGILVLGGDDVEIYNNTIIGNKTVGVAIFATTVAFKPEEVDVDPAPERIFVHNNRYSNNGFEPDKMASEVGVPGADILWDVSNWDVRITEPGASRFPPLLPGDWPALLRKAYWQVLNFAIQKLL